MTLGAASRIPTRPATAPFRSQAAEKRREQRWLEDDEYWMAKSEREAKEQAEREALDKDVIATAEQLSVFSRRLDRYDAAIVEALMENEHGLDRIRVERETMLSSAYQLPDGRRAFKTEDGRHVRDQSGAELGPDVVGPELISARYPTWEAYQRHQGAEQKLLAERRELLDFQMGVDQARDVIGKNDVTARDLDQFGADFERNMPAAVREKLAVQGPGRGVDQATVADRPSANVTTDVPARSGFGSASPEPGLR